MPSAVPGAKVSITNRTAGGMITQYLFAYYSSERLSESDFRRIQVKVKDPSLERLNRPADAVNELEILLEAARREMAAMQKQ